MAVTINASTTAGLVQTADTTGNLNLQSNGTTIAALTSTGLAVTGAGSFSTTLGVTGTSTTNIINAIKTTGGDTITFTNAAANNKTGFLYTDNDVVGLFTLANGQASANGVYFTSASAAVKVQVASSGVIGNFTSTGLSVTGTLGVTSAITSSQSITSATTIISTIGNSGTAFSATSATTGYIRGTIANTSGDINYGVEGATANVLATGTTAYDAVVRAKLGLSLAYADGTVGLRISNAGAVTIPGTLGVTGVSTFGQIKNSASFTAINAITPDNLFTGGSGSWVFGFINVASASVPYGIAVKYSIDSPNGTSNQFFYATDATTVRAEIRSNGGLANYSVNNVNLSDANVKSRIVPMGTQWDAWKKIEWMKFKYDDQTHDDWNYGYTAQNIESIYPELVDAWQPDKEDSTLKAVYSEDLKNITGSVLQEAQLRIEQLEARLAALEAK